MGRRGQASIETVFTVTVVLAVLVIVTATAITENNNLSNLETLLAQQDKCEEIAMILDTLALHEGTGNATIDVRGYELWVAGNSTIIIRTPGSQVNPSFCSTIAPAIVNETGGHVFHATSTKITATKKWGTITLEVE